ncbi:MAG: TraB/GumN family protein [Pseudomonadota bacterium]|nr:TraB/GumN family protein [Pseudomonadota bacterium]
MPHPTVRKQGLALLLSCLGAVAAPAFAQDVAGADEIRDVAPVVVSGELPGPGLWKVSKGEHVLWILGTQAPLPRRMQWHSEDVDEALAASQELIHAPVMGVTFEAGGFFKSLFLIPKVYGARKNPGDATLQDILPAGLYARWLPLRERYLGRGRKAEGMRPVFAAGELWSEALDEEGLVEGGIVGPVLERAVKAHGLRETRPQWILKITDAKAVLAEVEHANLDDVDCLEATIRELELGPERLRQRANAWASGDMAALRALPDAGRRSACSDAVMESPALRKRGGEGIDERMETLWLEAAEKALARNTSTFALLPISNLLSDDGYLARLAERGYAVVPPG